MTSVPIIFLFKNHVTHTSSINTIDGSQLHVNRIGPVAISNISLPVTFYTYKLVINRISVGQLCDLRQNAILSSYGCHM